MQVEQKKREYERKFLEVFGRHKKVNHSRYIHFISNVQPDEAKFQSLKNDISQIAEEMNYFAEELPTRWIELEIVLEVLKDLQETVYSWKNIEKLAHEISIGEKELLLFLNYQHKIGNIIFFEDKSDYIILQPNWLVECFRCLVCDDAKQTYRFSMQTEMYKLKHTGELTDNLIDELFKKDPNLRFIDYKDHILDVMEKFDIIVKPEFLTAKSSSYFMPCMIANHELSTMEKIKKEFKVQDNNCTPWLVFEFNFLPIAYYYHIMFNYIRKYKVCKEESEHPAIYAGKAVVSLDETKCRMLVICFSRNAISLQVWKWRHVEDSIHQTIIREICTKIEELKRKLTKNLHYEIKAKCSTGDYGSSSDRISCAELSTRCGKGTFYRCVEHDCQHSKEGIENTWLKHVFDVSIFTCICYHFCKLFKSNIKSLELSLRSLEKFFLCFL